MTRATRQRGQTGDKTGRYGVLRIGMGHSARSLGRYCVATQCTVLQRVELFLCGNAWNRTCAGKARLRMGSSDLGSGDTAVRCIVRRRLNGYVVFATAASRADPRESSSPPT